MHAVWVGQRGDLAHASKEATEVGAVVGRGVGAGCDGEDGGGVGVARPQSSKVLTAPSTRTTAMRESARYMPSRGRLGPLPSHRKVGVDRGLFVFHVSQLFGSSTAADDGSA